MRTAKRGEGVSLHGSATCGQPPSDKATSIQDGLDRCRGFVSYHDVFARGKQKPPRACGYGWVTGPGEPHRAAGDGIWQTLRIVWSLAIGVPIKPPDLPLKRSLRCMRYAH